MGLRLSAVKIGVELVKVRLRRTSHSSLRARRIINFFFSSRRRHTRFDCDWSSDVCSSDLKLAAQGNAGKDLLGLFSSFTANDPQYIVQINREKAKSLLVPFSQITDALQVYKIGRASCRERV